MALLDLYFYIRRIFIIKALKFSVKLPLLALTLLAFAQMSSSVAAQIEVADSGHKILVEHYQNLAKKAENKLDRDFAAAQSEYYSDNKEF